jgi:hypothetical protein
MATHQPGSPGFNPHTGYDCDGGFTGCYYNTLDLTGLRCSSEPIARSTFDWLSGLPVQSVSPHNFSVRWQGNFTFAAGTYTFTEIMSDGMRIYIDGNLAFNRWFHTTPPALSLHITLTQRNHLITVEFYERTRNPTAHVTWVTN